MLRWSPLALLLVAACSGGNDVSGGGAGAGGASTGGAPNGGSAGSGGSGGEAGSGGGSVGGGGHAPTITIEPIHDHHRFVDGAMFGGWGPHLGHLVRARASQGSGETLWLVDDYCAQPGDAGSACDVLHDHTLGYFERTPSGWEERATVAMPGQVQQNTATISSLDGDTLHTYGLDVGASILHDCSYAPVGGPLGCTTLPFSLGPSSNYLGAAVSPLGHRLVWWTGVVDGGGGSFHYVVDYGGGWNGPRSGGAAGYNDASYVNIAFGGGTEINRFTMHAQLVSGLAPNWGFHAGVGYGDLTTTDAVGWSMVLAPAGSDAIASTNDLWIDPQSNDTHLMARSEAGAAVYYHRPSGGSWSGAAFVLAATYRARFVLDGDRLVLVYGPNDGDLSYRVATPADRPPDSPIDWGALAETVVTLPASFGRVIAIYPESPSYQTLAPSGIHVALVGDGAENVVTHVGIEPGG